MSNSSELSFLKYYQYLDDPRIPGMISYPLDEILVLTLCAVICGAND
jgi:DDE family transposase